MNAIKKIHPILFFLLSLVLGGQLLAGRGNVFEQAYPFKEKLKLELVLGSCRIQKSTDDKIHVRVDYTYHDENFEIKVREKDRSLRLQEKIYGENASGDSEWTIHLPDDVEVDFKCATGDLSLDQVTVEIEGKSGTGNISVIESSGTFELKSGTGDVSAEGSHGEFDLASGTGNVNLRNCSGEFEVKSGTGDAEADGIQITDEAALKSGTGDTKVTDPGGDNFDLYIKSGTGDAILIFKETPLEGYFEFKATSPGGDIVSPVKFDKEETADSRENGYMIKSFTRGKSTPRYFISTGTGTAELKN